MWIKKENSGARKRNQVKIKHRLFSSDKSNNSKKKKRCKIMDDDNFVCAVRVYNFLFSFLVTAHKKKMCVWWMRNQCLNRKIPRNWFSFFSVCILWLLRRFFFLLLLYPFKRKPTNYFLRGKLNYFIFFISFMHIPNASIYTRFGKV